IFTVIEHLPQELRDRFTEMRELDLAVQNNMDSLDKKSRLFFQQCKRGELQHESMDSEFHSLRGEYFKVMEDADEKVAIATQIHELVERYLRRLDSELFKFKCELEADNNGITEILEKRSLELDGNNSTAATALLLSINQKDSSYYKTSSDNNGSLIGNVINKNTPTIISSTSNSSGSLLINNTSNLSNINSTVSGHQRNRKLEKRRETICTVPVQEKRANLNQSLPVVSISTAAGGSNISIPVAGSHVNSIATQVTLPVTGNSASNAVTVAVSSNVVRHLPANFTAHSIHSSNSNVAAPVAAGVTVAPTNNNNTGSVGAVGGSGSGVGVAGSHGSAIVSYNLQQLGGGGAASSAIAAAASQAIVATQQMPQGRRTASLKASYEAINGVGVAGSTEFWSAAAVHSNSMKPAAASLGSITNHHQQQQHQHQYHQHQDKKHKKKLNNIPMPSSMVVQSLGASSSGNLITSSTSSISVDSVDILGNATTTGMQHVSLGHSTLAINQQSANQLPNSHSAAAISATAVAVATATAPVILPNVNSVVTAAIGLPTSAMNPVTNLTISENGLVLEQSNEGEWSYDPNEPRYCTCNQVSYGDMVACDNDACPYEWFHYQCVGITQPPKGKWYCPKCTASMRRRGNRKN
ncbi:hypothetical protein KR222_006721, partial [Zaprionus bogoriensis]